MPCFAFPAGSFVALCAALRLKRRAPASDIVLYAGRPPVPPYPLPIADRTWTAIFDALPELAATLRVRSIALAEGWVDVEGERQPATLAGCRLIDSRAVAQVARRLLDEAGARFVGDGDLPAGAVIVASESAAGPPERWAASGDDPDDGGELLVRAAAADDLARGRRREGAMLWGLALPPTRPRQAGWGVVLAPAAWIAASAPRRRRDVEAWVGETFDWREVRLAGGRGASPGGTAEIAPGTAAATLPELACSPLAFGGELLAALQLGDALATSFRDSDTDLRQAAADYVQRQRRIANDQNRTVRSRRQWFARTQAVPARQHDRLVFNLLSVGLGRSYAEIDGAQPALTRRLRPVPDQPPLASPFRLRDLELPNRIVISPMAQYSAAQGAPGDWHLVHLGSRAVGGAGLVIAEMTCVSEQARITTVCPGLYDGAQVEAWRRIVRFVHEETPARIGVQIGHSGRKGSTRPLWEGMSRPLADGNWPLVAASAVSWTDGNQVPAALDRAGMDVIERQFGEAAEAADAAGFDLIELHFAHGYLMASFLSPLTNRRTDEFGGSLQNRLRFPLRVARAVRQALPAHKPLLVRISAVDWLPGGNTAADAVEIARAFRDAGCDLLVASAGQTTPASRPAYGPLFQVPFAERIRLEAVMPTMAVGAITTADEVNAIVAGGRADLCAVARMSLYDPYLPLRMMVASGAAPAWPKQYASLTRFQPALPEGG